MPVKAQVCDEAEVVPQLNLVACRCCGRKFTEDRIAKHEMACGQINSNSKKRGVFTAPRSYKSAEDEVKPKLMVVGKKLAKFDWKKESSEFRKFVKFVKKGDASEPQFVVLEGCKCCGRKFTTDRVAKHQAVCEGMVGKRSVFRPRTYKSGKTEIAAPVVREDSGVAKPLNRTWRFESAWFREQVRMAKNKENPEMAFNTCLRKAENASKKRGVFVARSYKCGDVEIKAPVVKAVERAEKLNANWRWMSVWFRESIKEAKNKKQAPTSVARKGGNKMSKRGVFSARSYKVGESTVRVPVFVAEASAEKLNKNWRWMSAWFRESVKEAKNVGLPTMDFHQCVRKAPNGANKRGVFAARTYVSGNTEIRAPAMNLKSTRNVAAPKLNANWKWMSAWFRESVKVARNGGVEKTGFKVVLQKVDGLKKRGVFSPRTYRSAGDVIRAPVSSVKSSEAAAKLNPYWRGESAWYRQQVRAAKTKAPELTMHTCRVTGRTFWFTKARLAKYMRAVEKRSALSKRGVFAPRTYKSDGIQFNAPTIVSAPRAKLNVTWKHESRSYRKAVRAAKQGFKMV